MNLRYLAPTRSPGRRLIESDVAMLNLFRCPCSGITQPRSKTRGFFP